MAGHAAAGKILQHLPLAAAAVVGIRAARVQGATGWRGNVWRLTIYLDVFEYLPDVGAEDTERNDAHLPTTYRAQQWENLVDASGWIGKDDRCSSSKCIFW